MPSDSLNNGNALIPEPDDGCLVSAAIYARQSRVRDVAYRSCQSQIDMCREFAASRDWSITQVYSDEGHSSETLDRPQMSRLIASIETGDVRRLVVYSLDRLSRRMLHFQELLKLFERHSVKLAVVNDPNFSDNATGRLMANIIAAANEFQLDLTKERMADMRAAYKRDGKRVAGRVPFGYQTDPVTKQLVVNEEQARRVHDFFALAAGGSRPSDLAGLANLQRWMDQKGETGKWTAIADLRGKVYASLIAHLESRGILPHRPLHAAACHGAKLTDINKSALQSFVKLAQQERQFAIGPGATVKDALTGLNLLDDGRPAPRSCRPASNHRVR